MAKTLDRELLVFFRTLYELRNLADAASALGIPVATASRMLARLRQEMNDELFTRCTTGLMPNWRAEASMPLVRQLLEGYERLLQGEVFDPRVLKRTFRVACADHAMLFLAPGFAKLAQSAPGISVDICALDNDWMMQLKRGEIDAVIYPAPVLPEGFHSLVLRENVSNNVVVRPGHPLEAVAKKKGFVSPEEMLSYGFVDVTFQPVEDYWNYRRNEGDFLSRRRIAVRVPYFFGVVRIISTSDLIAVMSSMMCEWIKPLDLVHVLPVDQVLDDRNFSPRLIWHERSHQDPAMQWLRSVLVQSCRAGANGMKADQAPVFSSRAA